MARAATVETVGGGRGPLSHPNTCRVELPRPLHAWPRLLPGDAALPLHPLCETHRDLPPPPPAPRRPPSPLNNCRPAPDDASGGQSDSDRRGAAGEVDARRVARRLRTIGDELDGAVHRRMHVAPQWQDWTDVCRGLLSFVTQTLGALYRLT